MSRKQANSVGNTAVLEPPEAAAAAFVPPFKQKMSPEKFWRFCEEYPDKEETVFHLYRLYPKIDRSLTGHGTTALDKQIEMDEQYILRTWGSGDYKVFFKDQKIKGKSEICHAILCLDHPDFPPVVDQAELVVGHPRNQGYIEQLKARGLWTRDSQKEGEMAAESVVTATAVQELAGLARQALERADAPRDVELANRKAIDILGGAYEEGVKRLASSPVGSDNTALMQVLLTLQQQQHDLLMKFLETRAAGAAGIERQIDAVDRLMAFAERVSGARGSPSFVDRLPDLAMQFLAAIASRMGGMPPAFNATAAPPVLPTPVQTAPGTGTDQEMKNLLATFGVPAEALPFVKVGIRAVGAFQQGFSGAAFAESVDKREGEEVYNGIAAFGKDALLAMLRKLPPAMLGPDAAAVIASPEIEAWIQDFLDYGKADEPAGGLQ